MVCHFPHRCHIKRVYVENNADGAKYRGELCKGCSWWKDLEPDPAPCPSPAQANASAPSAQAAPSAPPQHPDSQECQECEYQNHCQDDPQKEDYCPQPEPERRGWGGRRPGAGVKPGTFNNLKHGKQSVLIRRAVEVLAENKELRPFLLLIARAAVEGVIPQTTRQLIIETLGKTPLGMLPDTIQLKRLRNGQKV